MFPTRGFIFRKMVVYTVMVWYGIVCCKVHPFTGTEALYRPDGP
jgi:hypothetical protein